MVNGFSPHLNGVASPNPLAGGPIPAHAVPPSPASPVSFTEDQVAALRTQIHAFRSIQRGAPIPEHIQNALLPQNNAITALEKSVQGPDVPARIVDAAVKINGAPSEAHASATPEVRGSSEEKAAVKSEEQEIEVDGPLGPFLEEDTKSPIYPYNAYVHPFSHLKRPDNLSPAQQQLWATRLQRLLVPSVMPAGLDPHQVIAERNRYVDARIEQRIRELSDMPVTMGDGGLDSISFSNAVEGKENKENEDAQQQATLESISSTNKLMQLSRHAHGKLKALIELKALRVREKQRTLRSQVVERLNHGTLLPLDRKDFRRPRRPTLRDARTTEQLERKQRADRERRVKSKHLEQLGVICKHGQEMIAVNRAHQDRALKLGRAVQSMHAFTEKEEAKRIERISKERLKALKNDDEEAYMKLIDTAKDTRITHLLRQTDAYLDSLAQAVVAQQNDDVHGPAIITGQQEEGPADETMFGAQKVVDPDEKTKIDYYAVAHRIKEKISKQPNILVGGTLKEYQLKGLQWMVSLYNNRLNGILADEMGLGKTIQTISLITFLIETKKQRGPFLVIVPLSTMTNWTGEFAKWAPAVKTISYKGNPLQRRQLQNEIRMGNFQVLLTTYEYIIKDRPVLSKLKWLHIIIDEGHRMKNTQSKLSQTLSMYYHSRYRLILTGTPLQNNLPELWALLNFALPKIFNSVKSFDEWFNTPFANSGSSDKIELNEEEALLIIRRLHKVLRPFLLRRLKKDVESELPDKVEKIIKIRMSALQSQLYKQMKKYKMIADGKDAKGKSTGGVKGLSNELMQLRKICQHPFLFDSVEDKISPSGMIDDNIWRVAGKFELLVRVLPKFFATGHRVLIFFQMTKVMDIMEDFMKSQGWQYLRLDGGTKTEERASHVQVFNAKDSPIQVFILSTRAGGLGLNLQSADTVIIFDSDWNPHADLQAQDRAHRIGQTKAVRILRFITEKSVEEAMYARARYKLDIDDKVIQAGRFDNKSTQEEQEEFLRSILEADQEEDNEESGDMNDDEINEIIARNDNEIEVFKDMDIQRLRDQKNNWVMSGHHGPPPQPLIQLEELPECYRNDDYFEAVAMEEEAEGRGQRRRNVVSYNDGLSDDAWAMALEGDEDIEELIERSREKAQRRAANKLLRDSEGQSSRNSPAVDENRGRKKKGRPPKNAAVAAVVEADYEPSISNGKRKRPGKPVSVTPSIADDDDDRDAKRRKVKNAEVPPSVRERMKKVFNECYRAVQVCEDPDNGRRRWELFKELPDRRDYPDYYQMIAQPIAMSHLRKRAQTNYYKDVQQYRDEWRLMFNNARTYNVEGSLVYIDADEMEKVFNEVFNRLTVNSGLPGAEISENGGGGGAGSSSAVGMGDEEDRPVLSRRSIVRTNSKAILSDEDDYLTPSEDD
ncbi:SNF2-family ATP dependent chromatin remodeling factor snf21 [Fomitiporia mediterranea MF3/22]|uniref:SNF2-family ATP dependent chromatin remodeling factor snf21 n=1 Tax=Fomitiporia mediterranea (strain MF3/22) TaxID=694068 RepID=UPI00044089C0|nr:SNF2-family ATP dependent chromatin remodeling factor snf21 [Fomitiporia mediterranea MF3/22]EJD04470.1 SNF2-family ATP dependent chromatin remodeling factor snf21 [Fomitiporia mediterranea MF3/22]